MHALLVDDNPLDRRQLRRLLQQTNLAFDITEASDAFAAFEAMQAQRFDCIMVDQRMPGVIGTELVRGIRSIPGGAELTMIMVSGDEFIDARQSLEAGFDGYLAKDDLNVEALTSLLLGMTASRRTIAPSKTCQHHGDRPGGRKGQGRRKRRDRFTRNDLPGLGLPF